MEKTAEQLRREHIALEGDTHGKNKWAILFTVLVMLAMRGKLHRIDMVESLKSNE